MLLAPGRHGPPVPGAGRGPGARRALVRRQRRRAGAARPRRLRRRDGPPRRPAPQRHRGGRDAGAGATCRRCAEFNGLLAVAPSVRAKVLAAADARRSVSCWRPDRLRAPRRRPPWRRKPAARVTAHRIASIRRATPWMFASASPKPPVRSRWSWPPTPIPTPSGPSSRRRWRGDDRVLWLTDSRGREVAVPGQAHRLRRDRHVRRRPAHRLRELSPAQPRPRPLPVSPALVDRELLFVTGKGGVGKTTVAASLGLFAARQGKRTLVCEVDAKGTLAGAFECGPLAFAPRRRSQPGLFAMAMNTEDSLQRVPEPAAPPAAAWPASARWPARLDFVANAAPGVKEILTVGKLCLRGAGAPLRPRRRGRRGQRPHRRPAGQPRRRSTISSRSGWCADQTRWMIEILDDPDRTGRRRSSRHPRRCRSSRRSSWPAGSGTRRTSDLAAVVVNRVLPELFGRGEEEVFERLRSPEASRVLEAQGRGRCGATCSTPPSWPCSSAGPGSSTSRRCATALPPEVPMLYVPELFTRNLGHAACCPGSPRHWPRSCLMSPRRSAAPVVGTSGSGRRPARRRWWRPPSSSCWRPRRSSSRRGSGGVGKTTVAAALATMAAVHLGGKVLVLTVDPARRLATRPRARRRSGTWRSRCRRRPSPRRG